MNQPELYSSLKSLGLPVAYSAFTETPTSPLPKPPFITYQFAYDNDVIADNINFVEISNFQVELYTKIKDMAAEKLVQDKFKSLEMTYSKTEAWLDSEKLFQIVYEIQLIGG